MAHYDGVEAGPAAGDDAAGSAAILETLRALRAGPQLRHDVIAVFTDGEEAGLLGAAAFVREHSWIKDVGVALNFEARGTSGRSFMFETGPRNLGVARVLRAAPNVTAGSEFTAVYRMLPNDTDLSELAVAGVPALNFAFADGVDRYHTTHDDVAHLNAGSLQHHGMQMLALARAFGNGPLPRPSTSDGVFFTLPAIGLIAYPESWAIAFAAIAAVLVIVAVLRVRRSEPLWVSGVVLGAVALVASIAGSSAVAYVLGRGLERVHGSLPWGGAPAWSGVYWVAFALVAFAVTTAIYAGLRRRATGRAIHCGVLVIVALIALAVAARAPGFSYLFTWPLVVAALPLLVSRDVVIGRVRLGSVLGWVAAFLAIVFLVPIAFAISAIMLGLTGAGGIVAVVFVTLVAWLLAPLLESLTTGGRWSTPIACATGALALLAIGVLTVRSSGKHPVPSRLAYVVDADGKDAWLTTSGSMLRTNAWTRAVMDSTAPPPPWLARAAGANTVGRPVRRLPMDGPWAKVIADSSTPDGRKLSVRVGAAPGTIVIRMRVTGAPVVSSAIDGRLVDTTRFRRRSSEWVMQYWAPPDSGALIDLTIPAGARPTLELTARKDGLPSMPGIVLPPRPDFVVPVQTGDVTIVYRRVPIG
jgi:hypothetical protein